MLLGQRIDKLIALMKTYWQLASFDEAVMVELLSLAILHPYLLGEILFGRLHADIAKYQDEQVTRL